MITSNQNMILWMRYRFLYFAISLIFMGIGVLSLFKWGLNLGIDFTGGVVAEYKMPDGKIENVKYPVKSEEEIIKIRDEFNSKNAMELRFETVGPSIGPELVKKTYYAISISAFLILIWVAIQFKSLKFGVSAILAMIHDSIILIGSFSILGHFAAVEIDFLFVTAFRNVFIGCRFLANLFNLIVDGITNRSENSIASLRRRNRMLLEPATIGIHEKILRRIYQSISVGY